jgi:hypothetical protein
MPVLTCPFAAIGAQIMKAKNLAYPENVTLGTELTIHPTATETWSVEGLSIQFNLKYDARYYLNTTESLKALEEAKTFLGKQLTAAKVVETERKAIFEKEVTAANNAALWEAKAAVEGVEREIAIVEKEIKELGLAATSEGLKSPPLIITAQMYARGNELIWTQELSSLHFLTVQESNIKKGASGETVKYAGGTWYESFVNHIQFDDPIDITERENLRLTLKFSGPPVVFNLATTKLVGEGGPEIFSETEEKELHLSQVQAVVNYSRQVAS